MSTRNVYSRAVDLLGGVTATSRLLNAHRRTIEDRTRGQFRVTPEAAKDMATACRVRAAELMDVADALMTAAALHPGKEEPAE